MVFSDAASRVRVIVAAGLDRILSARGDGFGEKETLIALGLLVNHHGNQVSADGEEVTKRATAATKLMESAGKPRVDVGAGCSLRELDLESADLTAATW
ncbi:MAG: hypothetical protein WA354_07965 [Terracidiphilus sp.]